MQKYIEIIGLVAGLCTTFSFIPQVLTIWKIKRAQDVSLFMYAIISTGVLLWIVYGILIKSHPLIFANGVTLVFVVSILCMKIVWNKRS